MPSKQRSGMRGVYLTAAELSRMGYAVAVTARNAAGADLLIFTASTARAYSIEVKTNAKRASFWLVGEKALHTKAPNHLYVFLNISATKNCGEVFEYYVVPSRVVAKYTEVERNRRSTWYSFSIRHARPYRNKWSLLGSA